MVLSRVQKLLFALPAFAAVSLALAAGPTAQATDGSASAALVATSDDGDWVDELAVSNCTYYSNASYTTVVGRFGYDCCNNPVAWGKKSAFKICGGCFPCVPPGP
ncbi:MAG: hypothetical protein L6Q99_18310 [Planctomycetes bacterium]|nr:hypothetical protein [Planctomycetota bacterium]